MAKGSRRKVQAIKGISGAKFRAGKLRTPPVIIHEISPEGLHRIVIVKDGKTDSGAWTPFDRIAVLNRYRAATSAFSHLFPLGVFTFTAITGPVLD